MQVVEFVVRSHRASASKLGHKTAGMLEWVSSGEGMMLYSIVQGPFQVIVAAEGPPPLPEVSRWDG